MKDLNGAGPKEERFLFMNAVEVARVYAQTEINDTILCDVLFTRRMHRQPKQVGALTSTHHGDPLSELSAQ